jgi:hypothetical protein
MAGVLGAVGKKKCSGDAELFSADGCTPLSVRAPGCGARRRRTPCRASR